MCLISYWLRKVRHDNENAFVWSDKRELCLFKRDKVIEIKVYNNVFHTNINIKHVRLTQKLYIIKWRIIEETKIRLLQSVYSNA